MRRVQKSVEEVMKKIKKYFQIGWPFALVPTYILGDDILRVCTLINNVAHPTFILSIQVAFPVASRDGQRYRCKRRDSLRVKGQIKEVIL